MFTLFATGTGPNAFDEAHARTMAFTTLMMYQLFDVYNCRSRRRSAFNGFFDNKWLLVAIGFALGTHVLVVYVPFLQAAFHTVALTPTDWVVATAFSASLLIGMELVGSSRCAPSGAQACRLYDSDARHLANAIGRGRHPEDGQHDHSRRERGGSAPGHETTRNVSRRLRDEASGPGPSGSSW